jgi:hypothetical protein
MASPQQPTGVTYPELGEFFPKNRSRKAMVEIMNLIGLRFSMLTHIKQQIPYPADHFVSFPDGKVTCLAIWNQNIPH